ncbi:2-aminoadipate transaminase [Enhydrobacter aerosaccus]|uniref:2-aminoadipate transaminase n=1 Tax=Enhydrobacter aerosaccus TaxID=225324 RepID=A0A1T4R1K3_9HYPH|nr:PLP-dependent aminotransferase family protein [Enhydrobacter aerosaccus]SKA09879.1 2-aminoadipate transaminase [Enhydrobacter aerosaccus]
MTAPFDFAPLLAPGTPAPAVKWTGFPTYNFIGGHNDPKHLPVEALIEAATAVLRREGVTLATYGLNSGPLGYRPLREFLAGKLKGHAGIECSADEILITSGSMQGLELVNSLLVTKGDTVLVEQETYGGALTKLARLGAKVIGIPLDEEGLRLDVLKQKLEELKHNDVKPKYIYTIPTVQNPTGAIMGEARRRELIKLAAEYGVMIFEDECYSDLVWSGERPKSIYALAGGEGVIHIGSFSKSIAPALRVGYIVAKWDVLARILALKQDAGSGALEQMVLAEFCSRHFAAHVPKLSKALHAKLQTLREALAEQFGTSAEFGNPPGGIYLWIKLPDTVDTVKLAQAAQAAGVSINPGPEWSTDKDYARCRLRLCFANPEPETIRKGVEVLAEVCRREFGVPVRSSNVDKR